MKAFVILVCVCAVASAQFGSTFGQFGQPTQQTRQNSYRQPTQQPPQNYVRQPQAQTQQNTYNNQQSSFDSQPQQARQSAGPGSCRESNERYPVPGSCDRYVECINGTSEEKLCPDGLRFNPNVNFNVYPCQYPNDVQCLERSSLQPPQPTDACPNQFGYFRLGDARNCSYFRNCVNGVGYDIACPDGLAYNPDTYRCDWPDEVAECDAEAFLGFRCPEVPISKELGPPAGFRFYRSDTDCQKYFLCIEGRPRALSCGGDTGFDDLTSTCLPAEEVEACPLELREAAKAARRVANDLQAREIAANSLTPEQKRRHY